MSDKLLTANLTSIYPHLFEKIRELNNENKPTKLTLWLINDDIKLGSSRNILFPLCYKVEGKTTYLKLCPAVSLYFTAQGTFDKFGAQTLRGTEASSLESFLTSKKTYERELAKKVLLTTPEDQILLEEDQYYSSLEEVVVDFQSLKDVVVNRPYANLLQLKSNNHSYSIEGTIAKTPKKLIKEAFNQICCYNTAISSGKERIYIKLEGNQILFKVDFPRYNCIAIESIWKKVPLKDGPQLYDEICEILKFHLRCFDLLKKKDASLLKKNKSFYSFAKANRLSIYYYQLLKKEPDRLSYLTKATEKEKTRFGVGAPTREHFFYSLTELESILKQA